MIRTVLTDDHTIFLDGLGKLLADTNDFVIVGKFRDGPSLLNSIDILDANLLILDIDMQGMSGLEVIKRIRIRSKKIKIAILTLHDEIGYSMEAASLGANGLILKSVPTINLINTLHSIVSGIDFFPKKLKTVDSFSLLSDREIEILKLLSEGQSNEAVSQRLKISALTIKTHRKNILRKLGAENSLQMVRIAYEKGLV
ncbi:MAG: response regulator transcription factor [Cyclobacteriaceae bacterium]|nr:response regulator transcription factor [Cyclobacteriaceae bacterium]